MIQGLYAAANGMLSVEDRQAVIANNIANATTPGFKQQLAVQRGYYSAYSARGEKPTRFDYVRAPGGGIKTIETFSNFGNGVVLNTGNTLDVALDGPGFLRVQGQDGVRFTRSGRLSVGMGGVLVTSDGLPVLDANDEPIDVSGGSVRFDPAGNVYVNDELRGQLGITEFEDSHALAREGYTLFRASDEILAAGLPAEKTEVRSGSVETSNVQLPQEMANMLMALREYAANQRVIQSVNETVGRMINQVGGVR